MASEVLGTRWTPLIIRELLCGSHRFNDLRRGLPHISPALLSKRLRELEEQGIVSRQHDSENGSPFYRLTDSGEALHPVIMALGCWGQRWLEAQLSMKNLDPSLLMWDMRRHLDPSPLPPRQVTIQILYHDVTPRHSKWWLVIDKLGTDGAVDLCRKNPGHDIDLYVVSDLRSMTAIWMGLMTVKEAVDSGKLQLTGASHLKTSMQNWLGLSPFAGESGHVSS
ncbi:winged helix-turn-helix transcriptional regulator [Halomonas halmophila]|nr:helix-turn-helix domain-containing protein [Halomonas halmophila]